MSHIGEIAAGVAFAAAVGGAFVVLPQSKPLPVALEIEPKPVERSEPLREKSDAARVDDLQQQLVEIAAEHRRLTQEVKALVERETEANAQLQRKGPRR
jgi:hypothetical protein